VALSAGALREGVCAALGGRTCSGSAAEKIMTAGAVVNVSRRRGRDGRPAWYHPPRGLENVPPVRSPCEPKHARPRGFLCRTNTRLQQPRSRGHRARSLYSRQRVEPSRPEGLRRHDARPPQLLRARPARPPRRDRQGRRDVDSRARAARGPLPRTLRRAQIDPHVAARLPPLPLPRDEALALQLPLLSGVRGVGAQARARVRQVARRRLARHLGQHHHAEGVQGARPPRHHLGAQRPAAPADASSTSAPTS
jgi:hypothetical protein